MSRPLPQPPSQDWSSLLLDAIQKRDAPRAFELALRCVHRQGMGALETVLDRADAVSGEGGDARSWLFPLLKQGSAAGAPLPLPSETTTPPPLSTPSPSFTAAVPLAETAPLAEPLASAEAPGPESDPPPSFPATFSDPSSPSEPPFEPPASSDTSEFPSGSQEEVFADAAPTAALDQAFAPLEIAFPPLPTPERQAPPSPPAPSSPSTGGSPSFLAGFPGLSIRHERTGPEESVVGKDPTESREPPHPFAGSDPEKSADEVGGVDLPSVREPLLDDFPAGQAAPVPTFQLEASEEPADDKEPAPRSLEAWRAWLPGPFRSRSRP